jgi:hypothetical protein
MTDAEEHAVAVVLRGITDGARQKLCFHTLEEAQAVAHTARIHHDLPNLICGARRTPST